MPFLDSEFGPRSTAFPTRKQRAKDESSGSLEFVLTYNCIKSRDEFELEFSGSSEPELQKFQAEPSWGPSIFELKRS